MIISSASPQGCFQFSELTKIYREFFVREKFYLVFLKRNTFSVKSTTLKNCCGQMYKLLFSVVIKLSFLKNSSKKVLVLCLLLSFKCCFVWLVGFFLRGRRDIFRSDFLYLFFFLWAHDNYVYMKINVWVFEMNSYENNLIIQLKFYQNFEKQT